MEQKREERQFYCINIKKNSEYSDSGSQNRMFLSTPREKETERKNSEVLSILSKRLNISLKGPCDRLFAKLAAVIPTFVFMPFAT